MSILKGVPGSIILVSGARHEADQPINHEAIIINHSSSHRAAGGPARGELPTDPLASSIRESGMPCPWYGISAVIMYTETLS